MCMGVRLLCVSLNRRMGGKKKIENMHVARQFFPHTWAPSNMSGVYRARTMHRVE